MDYFDQEIQKEAKGQAKFVDNKIIVPGNYSTNVRCRILDFQCKIVREHSEIIDGVWHRIFEIA